MECATIRISVHALKRFGERVVHVVVAGNSLDATCVAVTANEPTAANWENELRTPKR